MPIFRGALFFAEETAFPPKYITIPSVLKLTATWFHALWSKAGVLTTAAPSVVRNTANIPRDSLSPTSNWPWSDMRVPELRSPVALNLNSTVKAERGMAKAFDRDKMLSIPLKDKASPSSPAAGMCTLESFVRKTFTEAGLLAYPLLSTTSYVNVSYNELSPVGVDTWGW